jgi:hypothetical protein
LVQRHGKKEPPSLHDCYIYQLSPGAPLALKRLENEQHFGAGRTMAAAFQEGPSFFDGQFSFHDLSFSYTGVQKGIILNGKEFFPIKNYQ